MIFVYPSWKFFAKGPDVITCLGARNDFRAKMDLCYLVSPVGLCKGFRMRKKLHEAP